MTTLPDQTGTPDWARPIIAKMQMDEDARYSGAVLQFRQNVADWIQSATDDMRRGFPPAHPKPVVPLHITFYWDPAISIWSQTPGQNDAQLVQPDTPVVAVPNQVQPLPPGLGRVGTTDTATELDQVFQLLKQIAAKMQITA